MFSGVMSLMGLSAQAIVAMGKVTLWFTLEMALSPSRLTPLPNKINIYTYTFNWGTGSFYVSYMNLMLTGSAI